MSQADQHHRSDPLEQRLRRDAESYRQPAPSGLSDAVRTRLSEPVARQSRRWFALAAAVALICFGLMTLRSSPAPSVPPSKLDFAQLRSALQVGDWVASSRTAVRDRLDEALVAEWDALVSDASLLARNMLEPIVRPVRELATSDSAPR